MKTIKLIPVSCPKCQVPITETIPGADVRCYRCGRWFKAVAGIAANQTEANPK